MKLPYQNAVFIKSTTHLRQAPFSVAEVAFAGRSNCGKSTLINVLTNQRKIAKVSKTPGRTREINYFSIGDDRFLVDLPGYGYAKVNTSMKQNWQALIESYLSGRDALKTLFILMDSRHPLQAMDELLIDYCYKKNIPVVLIGTKADQLNQAQKHKINTQVQEFIKEKYRFDFMRFYLTSSLKKTGFESVLNCLDEIFSE